MLKEKEIIIIKRLLYDSLNQETMENKIKLNVLGFSFNQAQTGTYGLVLSEENGLRRLMVLVGGPEAQSIAFKLQHIAPPRPLTHDLLKAIAETCDIKLKYIFINKYIDGAFHSDVVIEHPITHDDITIDARTSDAINMALRFNSPIYTTEEIMRTMGIVIDETVIEEEQEEDKELESEDSTSDKNINLELLNEDELKEMLKSAIQDEDYELASILRDEITRLNNEPNLDNIF